MMKKFTYLLSLICVLALFVMQTVLAANVFAVELAAENAITRAQEIVAELEAGIGQAESLLQQARESGDARTYREARKAKESAEQMLAQAKMHLADAVNMANDADSAPNDPAASAASHSSQAKAETSHSFARVGLLYLEALKFMAKSEINCSEKLNERLTADNNLKSLKKIRSLADQSLGHAKSAFENNAAAANESEKSEKTAKECIALARDLDLQLENFEDICDDFKKKWKNLKDQDDDEEPSPV